ncbi:MAG: bifunctional folylpolyglutamate synthase/dihydrofolate synthase [Bacteroidales bacterium]|nr:bifunctional folylpolyglutamate synthase/dihydrofolate synthase [Bacteroidales bacterium]
MEYGEVIGALFARHRSVQTAGFTSDAYKPGIAQMEEYAASLGHPERRFRSIHVAGTNGKGSVCTMLAAALSSSGLRTGLYTSPHLVDFRERIKIVNNNMIPQAEVVEFLERFDREGLSFFEVTTGMAFWWFARQEVDAAVIETGLGGRLDSTNIITPEISIITSIGLDHCALLGGTRAEIAAEKAGIFKPGVPALVWGRDPQTQPVFERIAAEKGSPLHYAEDFQVPEGLASDLAGPCQDINLRTVWAALSILGISGGEEGIRSAARITGFRGRWEVLLDKPLTICDIAHNPPALEQNFRRLEAMVSPAGAPPRPLVIVYGVMADKDVAGIAGLMPQDAEYFLVAPKGERAMPVKDLALKLKNLNFTESGPVAAGVEAALKRARDLAERGLDPIVYIGGSTFVVSEAISYLESV